MRDGGCIPTNRTTMKGTCGPRIFCYYAFPTKKCETRFFILKKKPFLENGLESPLIFVFILKGKTKYERKTINVTPDKKR